LTAPLEFTNFLKLFDQLHCSISSGCGFNASFAMWWLAFGYDFFSSMDCGERADLLCLKVIVRKSFL
jgi:hypothetical protein